MQITPLFKPKISYALFCIQADESNQAYTGKTWLLSIAGSAVLLLSSVLSNPIMPSAYGRPLISPQNIREDFERMLGQGLVILNPEDEEMLAEVRFEGSIIAERKAPPAITGNNVYVAWWTNTTGNDEVMFRASTDVGETMFGDRST